MSKKTINWYRFASPQAFYPLAGKMIPWFWALAALFGISGLVIGFLIASICASLISGGLGPDLSNAMVNEGLVRGIASPMRNWCFALAFTSIGLATNFRELAQYFKGGKPLILYVCGQSFNLILTLTMAYIMFYKVFPEITAKI